MNRLISMKISYFLRGLTIYLQMELQCKQKRYHAISNSSYQILQVLLGKSESNFCPLRIIFFFFFFFIVLLIKSYLSSVNSNTIHLQFDLFIINLFFLFTLIDRSIINTGLLKWFISFARINLDLLRDLVIQLLFVSFHFQYIYFSINFKINSRIDRSIENMKRYIFESQYIDRWSWIVQSDAKIELYRKS